MDGGEGRGRGVRRSWRESGAPWPTAGHNGATQAAAAAPGDMCEGGSQGCWRVCVCVCAAAHPRAISSDLMSFLIFQISMLASLFASAPSDMLTCHRVQAGVSARGSALSPHTGAAARLQLPSHGGGGLRQPEGHSVACGRPRLCLAAARASQSVVGELRLQCKN